MLRKRDSNPGTWLITDTRTTSAEARDLGGKVKVKMCLQDWLHLIPEFDGRPEHLEHFSASVNHVCAHLTRTSDQKLLLLALHTKLRSEAHDCFAHRLHQLSTVDDFLSELHSHFGGVGRESELFDRLYEARQEDGESVREFGLRIDLLSERLCSALRRFGVGVTKEVEEARGIARTTALASFTRGLRSMELEVHVAARRPQTLHEAIGVAIALDNLRRCVDGGMKRVQKSHAGRIERKSKR